VFAFHTFVPPRQNQNPGAIQLPSGLITNRPAPVTLAGLCNSRRPTGPSIITGGAAPVRSSLNIRLSINSPRPAPVLAQGHGPRARIVRQRNFFGLRL